MKPPAEAPSGRVVIALGNPFRGDDGVGWRWADRWKAEGELQGVEVDIHRQVTPEMAERLRRARRVVFVDAAAGGRPGAVACRPLSPQEGSLRRGVHAMGPADVLALCLALFGVCPSAAVVSVAAVCFTPGSALSDSVEKALPELEARVRACIRAAEGCAGCRLKKNGKATTGYLCTLLIRS